VLDKRNCFSWASVSIGKKKKKAKGKISHYENLPELIEIIINKDYSDYN